MTTDLCPLCNKNPILSDSKPFGVRVRKKSDSVKVCEECYNFLVSNHRITGKLRILRCKECATLKEVSFQQYKKRGRIKGSHNKPKPRPEIAQPLDAFAGPISKDENFQQYKKV